MKDLVKELKNTQNNAGTLTQTTYSQQQHWQRLHPEAIVRLKHLTHSTIRMTSVLVFATATVLMRN